LPETHTSWDAWTWHTNSSPSFFRGGYVGCALDLDERKEEEEEE